MNTNESDQDAWTDAEFRIGMDPKIFRPLLRGAREGEVGPLLRRIRLQQGMTLREAAGYAHLSPSHLDRIESGRRTPSRNKLIRLCSISYSLSVLQTNIILSLARYAPI